MTPEIQNKNELISMLIDEREAWKRTAIGLRDVISILSSIVAQPETEGDQALAKLNQIRRVLS